jgi:hypothetical protein
VVVICGRNKKLLVDMNRTVWPGGTHVVACGFVDNIHEVRAWSLSVCRTHRGMNACFKSDGLYHCQGNA